MAKEIEWRVAKALLKLRDQVNAKYPGRSKASDGTIGDAKHATRNSDHNPWVRDGKWGVVTGMDITNDPAHGLNSRAGAEALIATRDERIKYLISNGQICSGTGQDHPAWVWRTYTGTNAHRHHAHISVKPEKRFYDDDRPWGMKGAPPAYTPPPDHPTLRKGATGNDVATLQKLLNKNGAKPKLDEDAHFKQVDHDAVVKYQRAHDLEADGVVGAYTWESLYGRA